MKIISQPVDNWSMQHTCKKCESQLEAEKADICYGDFYSGMDADKSMEYYIICPVCNSTIIIDGKPIPQHVKYAAVKAFEDNGEKKVR